MDLVYFWEEDPTYIWDIGWWHERGNPCQLLPWEGMWWAQAWSLLHPTLWAQLAATLSDHWLLHSLPSWSISPSHPASVQSKLIRNSWPLHLLCSLLAAVIYQNAELNTSLQDTGIIIPWSLCCVTWASNTLKASGTCCHPSNRSSSTFQFFMILLYCGGYYWFPNLSLIWK